jgi:hypothetical protein
MGGNAMKHVGVERKSPKEYLEIAKQISDLAPTFAERHAIIPAYSEKESFGDLDCLVVVSPEIVDLKETLKETFKPTDIQKNGDVWSFDFQRLQIDVICSRERLFDCSLSYYSYNDVGNLMGRGVAHKMGLKYGHQGLILPVHADNTHLIGKVELSIQPKEIFEFLGYDHDRFLQGFKNLEEIFEYTTSSKYFNKSAFNPDELDHKNRVRNAIIVSK